MRKRKRIKIGAGAGCLMPLTIAVLAFLLFLSLLQLFPQWKASLGFKKFPTSFDELRSDRVMGYKTVELQESILGEARKTQHLVVREQVVQVDMELSQMLWNIPLFEKTKVIHASGTGMFGYDLSGLEEASVDVDHAGKLVVIAVGEPELLYVEPDYERTTFEETDRALLAFGDIKLTAEQSAVLQQQMVQSMREELENVTTAELQQDGQAALHALFGPLIESVVTGYEAVYR